MKIRLFGLLHLERAEHSAENVYTKDFQDQTGIYVKNAVNLSNSLERRGVGFVLLTNDKTAIDEIVSREGMKLEVQEISFRTKVPSGVRFYSAHFKLDVFHYFASLSDKYVGFCDLDMVCINDFPPAFYKNMEGGIPMFYDISDQVIPAYGADVIIHDLESIHHCKSEGRWSGGEFITGPPAFFANLSAEIDRIYENYLNVIGQSHHVGDEAVTSAALEIMRKSGTYIADAGTLGIVGRFWSGKVLHPQKPLKCFEICSLLHLPADKHFLAAMAKKDPSRLAVFKREYKAYLRSPIEKYKRIKRKILRKIRLVASTRGM